MASLRRRIFVILAWGAIFALFVLHMILSKDNNAQNFLIGLTRKREIQKKNELQRYDKVVSLRFDSQSTDSGFIEDSKRLWRMKPSTRTSLAPTVKKLSLPRTDQLFAIGEENLSLKKQITNLTKEIQHLLKSKKQLKSLTKKLVSQRKHHQENIPKLDPAIPWVFAITPTHTRYTQKADLVRLSQTLQHVTNLHWIIVEDSETSTQLVHNVLLDSGLSFTHLYTKTPPHMQRKKGEKYNKHHRGVAQRNLGLKWIRRNIKTKKTPGVVYFMDDDNTYHKKIFDEMRWTKRVSAWPVALTGAARFQGPIVSNGKVTGFHTNWARDRTFPLDMASFAVNLNVLLKDFPHVVFDQTALRGRLEPTFLSSITSMEELEPLADNCTKVLVWHTRTDVPKESIKGEKQLIKAGHPSDPNVET